MMSLKEFADRVKEEIADYLPPKYQDAEIELMTFEKNNGVKYVGISISGKGEELIPMLYLEAYHDGYRRGADMYEVLEAIADDYVKCLEMPTKEQVMGGVDIINFESVKDKIAYQLINKDANLHILKNVPHREIENLAAVYRLILSREEHGTSTALVTNTMLKEWGITEQRLQEVTDINASQLQPPVFMPMQNVLMNIMELEEGYTNLLEQDGIHDSDMMYVLTNESKMYGAAAMLDPEVVKKVGKILNCDYYVLPSTIHEVIILPKVEGLAPDILTEMVKEMNSNHIDLEDVLSNDIYEVKQGDETFKKVVLNQQNRDDHER